MYILIGILLIVIVYVIAFYNRLKTALVQIGASNQEIGNQLKRQADLIPNLVESAKGYLKHEKEIFTQLTDARKAINANQIEKSQKLISKALGALQVIVESNPEFKAATVMTDLMAELRDTSDKLMYARRTLIDLTADYNASLVTFPNSILAGLFNFQPQKGLEVTPEEIKKPEIKF
ncbi:MAG TPA: LemA family protein [Candidatus Woesebacteria bacterium]|nr:LemA family protein [Candidatus Woesebacteria bacterium]HRS22828.1 LemA family protein [Candidatus Woesebacteria bacterium]HRT40140.1 LemA family protein [Candidatus Woesebacteria bacterium]